MEYYIPLILILYYKSVVCLIGDTNNICYKQIRVEEIVQTGYNSNTVIPKHITIAECCNGYIRVGGRCEAPCATGCVNGNCSKPNECDCFENYFGELCDMKKCKVGYRGEYCNELCSRDTYGEDCKNKCSCENGSCNPVTGECKCYDGWRGQSCNVKCSCENGGKCIGNDTKCKCPPGFTGPTCGEPCNESFWGPDCKNKCECDGDGCNGVNGKCISSCEVGFYGKRCDKICPCVAEGTKMCFRDTGKCVCNPGVVGDRCERLEACPSMKFGAYCNNTCRCVSDHSEGCDQITGKCKCKAEWFGESCNQRCKCENGNCNEQGICKCYPGWEGNLCNSKCSEGYYGQDCAQKCSLPNSHYYECNYVNGPICKPGFGGTNCTVACSNGEYGSGCVPCSCNQATSKSCNRYTGDCECQPGWHGKNCEKQCPSGSYGENCKSSCACPECRSTDGFCRCQVGWEGETCQEYCPISNYNLKMRECFELNLSRYVVDKSTTDVQFPTILTISIICGIVVIIVILILLIAYYIKRKRTKKVPVTTTTDDFDDNECEISPPSTPVYEEIPYQNVEDEYNRLVHSEAEPDYLTPTDNAGQQNAAEKIIQNKYTSLASEYYNPSVRLPYTTTGEAIDEKRRIPPRNNKFIRRYPNVKRVEQFEYKTHHLSMDNTFPQRKLQTLSLDMRKNESRYTPEPCTMFPIVRGSR